MAQIEYEVVAHTRAGGERHHRYATEEPLRPGAVLRLEGRWWLVARVDGSRAAASPARYRLLLRHPGGRVESGAFRRYRPDAPRLGHAFTTIEDGSPAAWAVVDETIAQDEDGAPYLELIAARSYDEFEQPPDHELEHALAARTNRLPAEAADVLTRAARAGLAAELVALEPGETPDWENARGYVASLILEEIEDDLLELCGVDPRNDARETWLETVKRRLDADLDGLRSDLEGDSDEIEAWDFADGRIVAAVGSHDEEADPDSGFGRICRLVDASALGAAGFRRVRRPELELSE